MLESLYDNQDNFGSLFQRLICWLKQFFGGYSNCEVLFRFVVLWDGLVFGSQRNRLLTNC